MDEITNPTNTDTEDQNPAQPRSWRELPVHSAAKLFPLASAEELRELADYIDKHGLREPVALYDDPEIGLCLLDGRNRASALELIGKSIFDDTTDGRDNITTDTVGYGDPSFDPYAFVVSKNLHRRHLSAEQKRDIIAKLLTINPGQSNRAIAAITGRSHVTVGAVRKELESTGQIDQLTTAVGRDGRERPLRRLSDWEPRPAPSVEEMEKAGAEIRKELNLDAVRLAWRAVEEAEQGDLKAALENLITEAMAALGTYGGVQ